MDATITGEIALLWLASGLTAVVSAVLGLAGGIMLLALMLLFLDPAVAIPVHATAQLASNSSRALLHWRSLRRDLLFPYVLPLLPVGWLSVGLVRTAPPDLMRVLIGCFVVVATWRPSWLLFGLPPTRIPVGPRFALVGSLSGLLGPIIGATGPLTAPFFLGLGLSRFELIGTAAACQTAGHLAKIALFGSGGFDFGEHALLSLGMIVSVVLGTAVGTRLLERIPEERFPLLYKSALTLIAARLVGSGAARLLTGTGN